METVRNGKCHRKQTADVERGSGSEPQGERTRPRERRKGEKAGQEPTGVARDRTCKVNPPRSKIK